ncbi:AJAP1 protein, partial [Certhia brachydactyla]|nr:AJAP1 protein [Certhia brachydactyla]
SLSVRRSGCPLGSHAWILIAMFHLAMDLASCQPPATGTGGGRLSPRPALRHRLSRGSLWGTGSGEELHRPGPPWTCAPAPPLQRPRSRRSPPAAPLPSRPPATAAEARTLGRPVGWETAQVRVCRPPGRWRGHQEGRRVLEQSVPRGTSVPVAALPGTGVSVPVPVPPLPHSTALLASAGHAQWSPQFPSPLSFFLSAGLAVHQIITITVSLIMVIAALITTLVLKNCCAQSGRPRRNSHQRKLDQQEESCQNLTDFAPARVPSALDIFTAYNETLQCSHECVRTPVPVYAEDTLHSPGDYKTTFNGNRPSSSDRHLIPVAFVSEKWFEISC